MTAISVAVVSGCGGGESADGALSSARERAAAIPNASQGGLIINEVNAANWQGLLDSDGDAEDWVEIYNPTTAAVSLSGFGLSNKAASPFFWVFPAGTWISPKSYTTVWLSKKDRRVVGSQLHTNFNLDSGGDTIFLTAPNGTATGILVDTASPALVKPDQSWCRMPDGVASSPFMVCSQPTFGYANTGTAYPTILAKPTIAPASGFYSAAVQVTINGPAGSTIRYTTDGSEPTASSSVYSSPLTISTNTALRAAAFIAGAESSLIATSTYIVDPALATKYASLKAVMVAMPPSDLPRFQAGDKSLYSHAYVEMFASGVNLFKLDAEATAAGQNGSIGSPQRAMDIVARDVFGVKSVDAVLWPDKPSIKETKKFRLRNGSDDWQKSHIRDQLSQSLGGNGPNLYGSSNAVALFINGSYYGMMDLREREDETLAANNLAIDKDYVDDLFDPGLSGQEIKNGGAGAADRYSAFQNQVTGNDMADPAKYAQVKPLFNPESLAWDWALHLYLGANDWPHRNVHAWRSPEFDGRWNWHAHDLDVSLGLYNDAGLNATQYLTAPGSELIFALLKNPEFKNLFLNITADQMNAMTPAAMNARLDVMAADMQPYIADHFAKNSLGTEATWVGYINELRNYFSQRQGFYDLNTRAYFGLKNRGAVNVAVNDSAMGTVNVNTLDVGKLMQPGDPSWTGRYYPGVPVALEAKPKVGYAFVGWQGTSVASTNKISHTIPTASAVNQDGFSVRWTGQIKAPVTGDYRLQTISNDGVRVSFNGAQVINNWAPHNDATDTSAVVSLQAGQRYNVTVEYFDASGSATVRLLWQLPGGQTFMPIPASQLYADASATVSSGLTGNYFNSQDLSGSPVAQAIEPVDFVWGTDAPTPSTARFVAVFAPSTPASPSIQAVPAQSFRTGDIVALQVSATDPAGYALKYTAKQLPKGVNIHPTTGMIYGRITTPGTYNTTVTVTNSSKNSTAAIAWTVLDVAVPPGPTEVVPCGGESTSCAVANNATADVYFGADGRYVVKNNVTGQLTCNTATFGSDPAPNLYKHCFYVVTAAGNNQPPVVALTAPTANASYLTGATVVLTATATDSGGSVAKVEFFDGADLLGSVTAAPYTLSWTATTGSHSLTAKATDNLGAVGTSTAVSITVSSTAMVFCANENANCVLPAGATASVYFGANGSYAIKSNVTGQVGCTRAVFGGDPAPGVAKTCSYVVGGPGQPGNVAPTVSLTAPAANATFAAGEAVTLTATAADSDGTVSKVEFFDGTTLLGSSTAAPYTFNWTATLGTHSFTARATDNAGAQTTSAAVSVSVNGAGMPVFCANEYGLCVIPGNAAADVYFGAGSNLALKQGVSGSISCTRAAFGGDPAPNQAKSCSYVITSQGSNIAPTVAITAPSSGASYAVGALVTLTASAADSDGSIAKVEFFDGVTSIGSVVTAPYSITWTATAGSHNFTARATDNLGMQTTSQIVAVSASGASGNVFCANENAICTVPSGSEADVYFGANGSFAVLHNISGSIPCARSSFGTDPAPGVYKTCSYVLTGPGQGGNVAPTVALTSPTANGAYTVGQVVTLSANATDSDGNIAKVEFYDGNTLLGSATVAPFTFNWTATAGPHTFTARATDNLGAQATSASVAVSISGAAVPTPCASENGVCTVPAGKTADVYFGANGNFAVKNNVTGSIACTRAAFGGDPAPEVAKACSYLITSAP